MKNRDNYSVQRGFEMAKSIIHTEKECYLCRLFYGASNRKGLEKHHVMNGWGKRTPSDKTGLWMWLCNEHHREVHADAEMRNKLKQLAQICYERDGGSREEFMKLFGKNYL